MIRRRKVILGALGVAAGVTVAGCSKSGGAAGGSGVAEKPASGTWNAAPATAKAISLSVSPKAGATKVSPTSAVTIAVAGGKLQSCSVVASGDKVTGAMQDDGTWKSTGDLAYDKKYKVTATVVDSLGATVKKTSSFSTLSPSHTARTTFQANGLNALKAGGTYGMGQPIIVAFSHSVTNKAAAEKAISIETTPSVEGKFRWVSSSTVHWRPAKYWAKGTKIKVSVNTFGVHLGNGVYGSSDRSTHFTIGRQLLAVSDNNTHHTKVYIDGKLVRTMASSNGMGGYSKAADGHQLEFWTHGGPHVVLSKEATHSMSSASYGLTDPKNKYYYAPEIVKLCTRISYSGEFLHAAPWNHVLGRANISHGCVNLSVNDAQWVYDNFLIGDVVDVVNSPIKLPVTDGLGDWTVPYSKY